MTCPEREPERYTEKKGEREGGRERERKMFVVANEPLAPWSERVSSTPLVCLSTEQRTREISLFPSSAYLSER